MSDSILTSLLSDYEASREDARSLEAARVNIIGFALGTLSILGVVITKDCRVRALSPVCPNGEAEVLSDALMAVSPTLPLALMAFLVFVGYHAVLKGLYCRQLERQIRETLRKSAPDYALPSPIWSEIEAQLDRFSGRGSLMAPVFSMMILSALLIFGGYTAAIFTVVPFAVQRAMALSYGPAIAFLLTLAFVVLRKGRRLYLKLETDAIRELEIPLATARPGFGRLLGFHLLPRAGADVVFKGVFVILGAIGYVAISADVGVSFEPPEVSRVCLGVVAVLAFEFVLYQGRYLINDLRGFEQDAMHPDVTRRRRLAAFYSNADDAIHSVLINLVIRLAVCVAALSFLETRFILPTSIIATVLLLTSSAYDTLRERAARSRGPGRRTSAAIHVLVGSGYAVRAAFGCVLVAQILYLPFSPSSTILIASFIWVYGTFFISLAFALDATAHVDASVGARDLWLIPGQTVVSEQLWGKPHLATHLRFLGLTATTTASRVDFAGAMRGMTSRFLDAGDRPTPWRLVPTLGASGAAYAFAAVVCSFSVGWICVCAFIGLLAGNLLWPFGAKGRVVAAPVGAGILLATLALATAATKDPMSSFLAGWPRLGLVLAPWLMVAIVNATFRSQSRYEQVHLLADLLSRRVRPLFIRCTLALIELLLGSVARSTARRWIEK